MDIRVEQLLRCLAYLRGRIRIGATPVLEPFRIDPADIGDVNRAASRIGRHAGLGRLLFIVTESKLDDHVAGNIELRMGGTEVFVNISATARRFGSATLALLAHETAHKALFDVGVKPNPIHQQEYEILTDVAAVYLGFGKLLLNGYEVVTVQHTQGGQQRSRHRFGYVSVREVAFAHAVTVSMRGLSMSELTDGLSPFAARALDTLYDDALYLSHIAKAERLVPARDYV